MKKRIAKERGEDASLAKRWKKKKKTERKTKKERNKCESYFVVHEFLSMRVYYRKRNTFTMQSFSRFCFWLLVSSLSFLFLRVKRDASRMATRDGEELAVRRAEEVCFSRFISSTFSIVVVRVV